MPDAMQSLRDRLAELADLQALGNLAGWDQRTMMPPQGGPSRALQLATLARLGHERATAEEIGEWLEELEGRADELDELERDIVRIARRDYDRRRRVPVELAAELAEAASTGEDVWEQARANADFDAFTPALERNVELARAYADCFDDVAEPYDALLADYDAGLTATRIEELFAPLRERLPDLVAEASRRPRPEQPDIPVDVQRRVVERVLARVGVDEQSWRVDVSAHPFTSWIGRGDTRLTTRYDDGGLESVLAALHEFGHGLYDRQVAPELDRTGLGEGTSMSVHESQSKLWEDHVGRHRAFAVVIAGELAEAGFGIDPAVLHAAVTDVRAGLIRVNADPVSYPLHIVLRFELERALISGTLAVADVPDAWNEGMRRLLGVEVPDVASGALQDVHWAGGAFGYFPTYAIGSLIAAQLWEALERDLGPRDEALARGEVAAIREWLGERVHRHGRRLDTEPLVEAAVGAKLDAEPFLRHAAALAA